MFYRGGVVVVVVVSLFLCFSVLFVARRNIYASHNFHGSREKHVTMFI